MLGCAGPLARQLIYPWAKGLTVDAIVDYYDEQGFKDWTHGISGTDQLKAQHPEFEMWSQGAKATGSGTD